MSASLILITTQTNKEMLCDIKSENLILHPKQEVISFLTSLGRDVNGLYSVSPGNEEMDIQLSDSTFINIFFSEKCGDEKCGGISAISFQIPYNHSSGGDIFSDAVLSFLEAVLKRFGGRLVDGDQGDVFWDVNELKRAE